jgi:hypothetical protein
MSTKLPCGYGVISLTSTPTHAPGGKLRLLTLFDTGGVLIATIKSRQDDR